MMKVLRNFFENRICRLIILISIVSILTFICVAPGKAYASSTDTESTGTTSTGTASDDGISVNIGGTTIDISSDGTDTSWSSTLQILLVLTIISLAPSILIMMTSFTRIIVVLHFLRSALGTQTTPPNQVLIGLALFLTLFIMSPVLSRVNTEAIQPLSNGEITQEQALEAGMQPVREFMLSQIHDDGSELTLFLELSGVEEVNSEADIPTTALIPAFILSELKTAFIIGFLIYLPFVVIDMVVSSTLMSMGMMMLPPTTISMPFKILLFIMADGWNLVIGEVVKTFYTY